MGALFSRLPGVKTPDIPKTVLITGGTTGIGRAAVELLAARGDLVLTCGRNAAQLEELRKIPNVRAWACDVSNEGSVKFFLQNVRAELQDRPLDVLVNNAGMIRIGDPLLGMDTATFDELWRVNVQGVFLVTRTAWPLLARGERPIIINIGTTAEIPPFAQAFQAIYAMSKSALRCYSNGLRQELALLRPKGRVVHLKVGAHMSSFDHYRDKDVIRARLESYGPPFAAHAVALKESIIDAFKLITMSPADDMARVIAAVAHPAGGTEALGREYSINVSFLERMVAWLPTWIMDMFVVKALRK